MTPIARTRAAVALAVTLSAAPVVTVAPEMTGCAAFNSPGAKVVERELIEAAVAGCVAEAVSMDVGYLAGLCGATESVIEFLLRKKMTGFRRYAEARARAAGRPLDDAGMP